MEINTPAVVAEVSAAFAAYETALMSNDIESLVALFWDSAATVRYGTGENLHGHAQIVRFRQQRAGGSPQRSLSRTVISTFGRDFATANTEFVRDGSSLAGRQSHTWVRLPAGWRIVAAHVSFMSNQS